MKLRKMYLFSLKTNSVETDALILPFEENVTIPESFDGLEIVSFFDRSNRLNFANPIVLPCSVEYENIGTGNTLNNSSAFLLKLSKLDKLSFCWVVVSFCCVVVSAWANEQQEQSSKRTRRKNLPGIIILFKTYPSFVNSFLACNFR